MNRNVNDILRSEEQLRNTLHCDDKEKLRRKLAQLQREYLRTAQRLKRAERLEAVRRHVKSRISQQNHQDQTDPRPSSSTPLLNTSSGKDGGGAQQQEHPEGPADCHTSRRSQVIRFTLPSDAACPQTSDPSDDLSRGHKHSPALRLRSQSSRLRWERRSTEAGRNAGGSQEQIQERSERLQTDKTAEEEKTDKPMEGDAVSVSEFSHTESEYPSLLLTHWSSQGHNEMGDKEGKEIQRLHKQREKETNSKVEGICKQALTTEERGQNGEKGEDAASVRGQEEVRSHKDNSDGNTEEQNEVKTIENDKYDNVETKEKLSGITGGEKTVSLLDSCTLVEGLLYPVEYYVRTTRRMTFSQSQPDMQAVIHSQLNMGRHRRSRGRGRRAGRDAQTRKCSDQDTQTDLSSPTPASTSQDPPYGSQVQTPSAEPCRAFCEIPDPNLDSCFSPSVTATHPPRGRRKRRGRGRGRSQTPQSPLDCKQTGPLQAPITPVSSSQSLLKANRASPCLNPHEAVPEPDKYKPASTHNPDSQSSSEVNGAPSISASGHVEKVYPIFLKNTTKTNQLRQMNRGPSSWTSLLLPSSSSSSPAQTSLLPVSSLSSGSLLSSLKNLDFYQDFHLPDDQFASLKLLKLREVAVEAGLEHFSTPCHITRSSIRHWKPCYGSSEPLTPLPLQLSSTPTITNSPHPHEDEKTATPQRKDVQDTSAARLSPDELSNRSLTEEHNISETDVKQNTETLIPPSNGKHSISPYSTCRSLNCIDRSHPQQNSSRGPACKVDGQLNEPEGQQPPTEKQHFQDQMYVKPREEHEDSETPSLDFFQNETLNEPSSSCLALQASHGAKAQAESPVHALNLQHNSEDLTESSQPEKLFSDGLTANKSTSQPHHSQLLLSSPLASAPCPFVTPHLPSSSLIPSPILPSLGLTPHPAAGTLPGSFSPSAPSLALPPPHSPSTQDFSPPPLSPCPSITSLPPSLPPLSPSKHIQASCEPPAMNNQCQVVEPACYPAASSIHLNNSSEQVGLTAEESEEKSTVRHKHTLKRAAGGSLVDTCCLPGPSGALCVAAAGKWAVCLWSQTSASDWSLTHTWTFSEPVISVFPVPDAAGMMCVTLGKLEIREVRMLSCSSLMQMLICEGVIQVVVGVSKSRVVTSYHSAAGSTLQVFTLSESNRTPSSRPLVSPGVPVGALAPVDGLSDALIGTDEGGHLFVWLLGISACGRMSTIRELFLVQSHLCFSFLTWRNLKSGQLLCRVLLSDGFSHTACLRGYSYSGVLFVLLQHQFLNTLEDEGGGKLKDLTSSEEEMKTTLFSLVGINPLSGKCVLVTRLHPPKAWSGRLCEADVNHSSVVGLSQSGCVCVWELGQRGSPMMAGPPEGEVWQLARWGEGDTLVIGHHNGDVSLLAAHHK